MSTHNKVKYNLVKYNFYFPQKNQYILNYKYLIISSIIIKTCFVKSKTKSRTPNCGRARQLIGSSLTCSR